MNKLLLFLLLGATFGAHQIVASEQKIARQTLDALQLLDNALERGEKFEKACDQAAWKFAHDLYLPDHHMTSVQQIQTDAALIRNAQHFDFKIYADCMNWLDCWQDCVAHGEQPDELYSEAQKYVQRCEQLPRLLLAQTIKIDALQEQVNELAQGQQSIAHDVKTLLAFQIKNFE